LSFWRIAICVHDGASGHIALGAKPRDGAGLVSPRRHARRQKHFVGALPEIYANGTSVGSIPHSSRFYRDFAPGTYRFTVQSYGLPNDKADTVQLAPGTISYVWVESAPPWQFGYVGHGGSNRRSFFVYSVTPQIAQPSFQAMTDLGQR
jgi:hypothetical protein